MRLTVDTAVSGRPVKKDDFEPWANREGIVLLRQIRDALNYRGLEKPDAVTSDGAGSYTTLWTSEALPEDCIQTVEAEVVGVGGTQRATYRLLQTVTSIAGTVAALGTNTILHAAETAIACDARISVDVANRVVIVEARDEATTAMQWTVVVQTGEGQ